MRAVFNSIAAIAYCFVLGYGLIVYRVTRRTPLYSAFALRQLFCLTNGRINDLAGSISAAVHPPYGLATVEGVLGTLDNRALSRIADEIREKGFFVFDRKLSASTCQEITELALRIPATLIPPPNGRGKTAVYERQQLLATRYDFDERAIFQSQTLQELAVDRSLLGVAQAYLGCRPIHDLTAMWWTVPYGSRPSSAAAQLYHFDMDRFRFIKFFVYLTDVEPENGPHSYVRGSHVRKPRSLSRDGRFQDDEIVNYYGPERIIEIGGPKGTIFAADTRGFHKGKAPIAGERLVFQIEYANSLFGAPYTPIQTSTDWSAAALAEISQFPYSFQRFGR